jgi:hypothetical protein
MRGTSRSCRRVDDRVILSQQSTRNLLRDYARGQYEDEQEPVSLSAVLHDCAQRDKPWLRPIVETVLGAEGKYQTGCPADLQRLLLAVAMPTPVSGFVLNADDMVPLLKRMGGGAAVRGSVQDLRLLADNCPCLFALQQTHWWPDLTAPVWIRPLLFHLADLLPRFVEGECTLLRWSCLPAEAPKETKTVPEQKEIFWQQGPTPVSLELILPQTGLEVVTSPNAFDVTGMATAGTSQSRKAPQSAAATVSAKTPTPSLCLMACC